MTGRFDTFIYTNCRADEGLQHRDGFQFQAVSKDADLTAMAVIQRSLLYEPSPQWMRERRPVSDYPPSLAHFCDADGLYATAAGVYLGRESRGSREGNQLTHAIATRKASSYGLIRPAQMFGAPFWATVTAPTQQCPALEPGWRPGPFGVREAQHFVRAQPDGVGLLIDLVSELRRGDGERRRILFVAHEPELVLRWVTAATVLVPQSQALTITFKIFTQNPAYAEHRILAVHPDWSSGGADIDNDLGYAVFDLVRAQRSRLRADPDSRRWVELFVTEDPYDIMDAVEVAAASGLPGADAIVFALASVLGRPPGAAHIRALVDWLTQGNAALVRRYGPGVVDQLLVTVDRWPIAEIVRLDAATSANLPERAAVVRLHLLRAELAALRDTGQVPSGTLPPISPEGWESPAENEAAGLFAEALRPAAPYLFDALLRLANRFSCALPLNQLEPGLGNFVNYWATHPREGYDPGAWPAGQKITQRLRDVLGRRLAADRSRADEIGDDWWSVLIVDAMDLRTPLDAVIVSAAMTQISDRARRRMADQSLRSAREAADPVAAFTRTAAVLWRRSTPTFADAQQLCHLMPSGMAFDAETFPVLSRRLRHTGEITDDEFAAAYLLVVTHGVWQAGADVHAALINEETVRMVERDICRYSVDPGELAEAISRVPIQTMAEHRTRLLDAMIAAKVSAGVFAVLQVAPHLGGAYAERLARRVTEKDWEPGHMAMAFMLSQGAIPEVVGLMRSHFAESLAESVTNLLQRASNGKLEPVEKQIEQIGPPWPARFAALKRRERHGSPLRRIVRRGQ